MRLSGLLLCATPARNLEHTGAASFRHAPGRLCTQLAPELQSPGVWYPVLACAEGQWHKIECPHAYRLGTPSRARGVLCSFPQISPRLHASAFSLVETESAPGGRLAAASPWVQSPARLVEAAGEQPGSLIVPLFCSLVDQAYTLENHEGPHRFWAGLGPGLPAALRWSSKLSGEWEDVKSHTYASV